MLEVASTEAAVERPLVELGVGVNPRRTLVHCMMPWFMST
jgi:hypothetical protein